MSGQQNAFANNGLQMPMFTGVSAQNGQVKSFANEYELSDVFADYFVNELDEPFNSFNQYAAAENTASNVANPLQPLPPSASSNNQGPLLPSGPIIPVDVNTNNMSSLPTKRGITTAWHTGNAPSLQGTIHSGISIQQQQQQQQQQHAVGPLAHIAKKTET